MNRSTLILFLFIFCISENVHGQVDTINTDAVFESVEIEAKFPGGDQAWRKYLEKNLKASTPVDNGAPSGYYRVWARFVVSADGSISDVKALTKIGYGMEAEVLRIIRKSGKWEPAYQRGRNVKAYRLQPVIFVVEDGSFTISSNSPAPYTLITKINNEITVDAGKIKNEDLQLTISQGQITRGTDGKFLVRVNNPGRVVITVFNNKKQTRIGAANFQVLNEGEDADKPPVVFDKQD